MAYPSLQQYNEALQHPNRALSDSNLRNGTVKKNNFGLPSAVSGGFALTYRISWGANTYALRCFQKQSTDLQQRYREISLKLEAIRSEYFVKCDFQPQGVLVNGSWYPVVKMDWARGETLGEFIEKNYNNKTNLRNLINAFERLSLYLDNQKIAHGDIQPGNVMISDGGQTVQLIDYDGMYLPSLSTYGSSEFGLPNFQHPQRTTECWDYTLDRFSFIALNIAFRALELEPNLWIKTNSDSETILFTASDYHNPGSSAVFAELFKKYPIEKDARAFAAICKSPYSQIPTLNDFVSTKRRSPATFVTKPTIAFEQTPYSSSLKVLNPSNYFECLYYVGQRVELVGKIIEVSKRKDKNDNDYYFVNFGDWREKIVKLSIWSDSIKIFKDPPGRGWVDRWVSVTGLMDPEFTNTRGYKSLSVTITQANQIHFLTYPEAQRRLYNQWKPPATQRQQITNDGIPGWTPPAVNSDRPQGQIQGTATQTQTQITKSQAPTQTPTQQSQTQTSKSQIQSQTTSTTVVDNQKVNQDIQKKLSSSQTQPTKWIPPSAYPTVNPPITNTTQIPGAQQTTQKNLSQSTTPPQSFEDKYCFIATALYGIDGEETITLRYYRDRALMKSWFGRALVKAYYQISPHLVPIIEKNKKIKKFARLIADRIVRSIKLRF